MIQVTNQLVAATAKKLALPGALAGAFALGAAMFVGHGSVHAASAIDDNSVAALTSLDRAMEAVASRVTPAVVNVAVTARGNGEVSASGSPMQGLPPRTAAVLRANATVSAAARNRAWSW